MKVMWITAVLNERTIFTLLTINSGKLLQNGCSRSDKNSYSRKAWETSTRIKMIQKITSGNLRIRDTKSIVPHKKSKKSSNEFLCEFHGLLFLLNTRMPIKSAAASPTNNIPNKMVYMDLTNSIMKIKSPDD
jgi:hypothetical protein